MDPYAKLLTAIIAELIFMAISLWDSTSTDGQALNLYSKALVLLATMHILMGFFPAGNASRPLAFDFPATAPPRGNPDLADGQRLLIPTPDCNADEPQHKSADWR